jgi:hypothetical protein
MESSAAPSDRGRTADGLAAGVRQVRIHAAEMVRAGENQHTKHKSKMKTKTKAGITNKTPWKIGKNYFIRTVTHHYTGRLEQVFPGELVISQAAWIADDGRFSQALATGEFNEVEMYPPNSLVILGRGAIIDATILPRIPSTTN